MVSLAINTDLASGTLLSHDASLLLVLGRGKVPAVKASIIFWISINGLDDSRDAATPWVGQTIALLSQPDRTRLEAPVA
jgi:hypothetical protein